MSILRQNLAYLMDMHQLSANALAQASGAAQPTISRILSGDSADPRAQSLQPIADYFKVDVEDLRGKLLEGAGSIQLLGAITQRKHSVKRVEKGWAERTGAEYYQRIEDEVKSLLPDTLQRYFQAADPLLPGSQDTKFRCDYISEKLLFDLKVVTFRRAIDGLPRFSDSSFSGVVQCLWHIASLRLMNKEHFPLRRHVMFVVFVDDETKLPSSLVTPPSIFHSYQAEAQLHGITLLKSTPALIASTVLEAEGL